MDDLIIEYIKNNQLNDLLLLLAGTNRYTFALEKAAFYKKTDFVNQLIQEFEKNPIELQTAYNCALYGYVCGQHDDEAKEMIQQGANIQYAINAFIHHNGYSINRAQEEAERLLLCKNLSPFF